VGKETLVQYSAYKRGERGGKIGEGDMGMPFSYFGEKGGRMVPCRRGKRDKILRRGGDLDLSCRPQRGRGDASIFSGGREGVVRRKKKNGPYHHFHRRGREISALPRGGEEEEGGQRASPKEKGEEGHSSNFYSLPDEGGKKEVLLSPVGKRKDALGGSQEKKG